MPRVVWFHRLDGGNQSVDLDHCVEWPVMSPPRHQFDRNLELRATFYHTPDGQWIAPFHRDLPDAGYVEVTRHEVYTEMLEAGVWPIPAELLPEAPRAPLSDPGEGTANLPAPSGKSTPETDTDVWISFQEALEISALLQPQLTKMCNSGKITARGKRKGRQVCLDSLLKFMGKTSLGWARIHSNIPDTFHEKRGLGGVRPSFKFNLKLGLTSRQEARERRIVGSLKPFRWNPAGNQSRPVEPDQQPEASLAWWVGDHPCEA